MVPIEIAELAEALEQWEGYDHNLSLSENLIELQLDLGTYHASDQILELLKKPF